MSSRNAYLSADERQEALSLSRGLAAAEARFKAGERDPDRLVEAAHDELAGRVDYVELRDADTLELVRSVERPVVLAVAVFIGKTRLIDNRVFTP